jgi:uncharacterized DUF497 family protein
MLTQLLDSRLRRMQIYVDLDLGVTHSTWITRQNIERVLIPKYIIVYTIMYSKNMQFEWDLDKDRVNRSKHGISFEEAAQIFLYPIHEMVDSKANYGETRYIAIGQNNLMLIITVVYTEREEIIRIISARRATKKEKQLYYEYCT